MPPPIITFYMPSYYKILLPSLLLCASLCGYGQVYVDRSSPVITVQDARLSAKYNFKIPVVADTTSAL
jgi:hypothetical protein